MANFKASIIIPTKNGIAHLEKVLQTIYMQAYDQPFEVIVIDSGSIDGTLDIVRRYPVKLIEIRPEDFGHGKTRNLGAELAKGDYLVFLTQDAIPATERWLFNLTANLERPEVAGVYGRQIPREGTNPMERFFLNTHYPPHRMVKSGKQGKTDITTIFFSNVNSVIRREVFERYPFSEDLIMSEDQEWAKRVLLAGYDIVYDPEAAVYHSHNYSLRAVFQRYFDSGVSLGKFAKSEYSAGAFTGSGLKYLKEELMFLAGNGYFKWIPYAVLYDLSKFIGVSLGRKEKYLPATVKKRISLNSYYWLAGSKGERGQRAS